MATNPSNSNAINIINLPKAQIAANGDYLILETPNGTQVLDFELFNAVKTDVFGNATIVGNLTGKDALLANIRVNSLSANEIHTSRGQGVNASNDYYDRFTVEDGIVLSASRNTESNPIFTTITQTILPNLTSYMSTLFRKIVEISGRAEISTGNTETTVIINNFFDNYPWIPNAQIISPVDFILQGVSDPGSGDPGLRAGYNLTSAPNGGINLRITELVGGITPTSPSQNPSLEQRIRSTFGTIPSLSSMPVIPVILPANIIPTPGNGLQFTITLPYPSYTKTVVFWKLLKTG